MTGFKIPIGKGSGASTLTWTEKLRSRTLKSDNDFSGEFIINEKSCISYYADTAFE